MLILSRKAGEEIVIGEGPRQVRVKVCEVRGDKVRLGLDAAREVPIWRQELLDEGRAGRTGQGGAA